LHLVGILFPHIDQLSYFQFLNMNSPLCTMSVVGGYRTYSKQKNESLGPQWLVPVVEMCSALVRSTVYWWSWRRHHSGSVSLSYRQRQYSGWRPQIRITVGQDSYMNRVGHAVAGLGRLSRNLAEHQYQGPGGNLKLISTADRDGSANEITPTRRSKKCVNAVGQIRALN